MFEAYQSVSGNQHQLNLNRLSNNGYRMISLSVYGDPSDPRYAAVWVQRSGPAWVAVLGNKYLIYRKQKKYETG